jgi:hypothetical protein
MTPFDWTSIPAHVAKYATHFVCLIFLVCLVVACIAGQTSVIVYKDSTKIIAGFDSKGRAAHGGDMVMCKVKRLGSLFWLASGKDLDYKPIIVTSKRSRQSSIREIAENFSTIAPQPLKGGLYELRREDPDDYHRLMVLDGGKLQIIFFGMEGKTPTVAVVEITLTEDSKHQINTSVVTHTYDNPCQPIDLPCGFTAGNDAAMQQYMAVQPMRYLIESEINYLIQMECRFIPALSGLPTAHSLRS